MGEFLEEGVIFMHVRFQMGGPGGVGKSTTIGAMQGMRFAIDKKTGEMFAVDASGKRLESTVGAELQVWECAQK